MTFKTFVATATVALLPVAGFAASEAALIHSTGNPVMYNAPDSTNTPVALMDTGIPGTRHLIVDARICERDKPNVIDWAANTEGYAAMAVPTLPSSVPDDCSQQNPEVVSGLSNNFATQELADTIALEICNASLLEGYGECTIIARVRDS
jgi:hypothetical protein